MVVLAVEVTAAPPLPTELPLPEVSALCQLLWRTLNISSLLFRVKTISGLFHEGEVDLRMQYPPGGGQGWTTRNQMRAGASSCRMAVAVAYKHCINPTLQMQPAYTHSPGAERWTQMYSLPIHNNYHPVSRKKQVSLYLIGLCKETVLSRYVLLTLLSFLCIPRYNLYCNICFSVSAHSDTYSTEFPYSRTLPSQVLLWGLGKVVF